MRGNYRARTAEQRARAAEQTRARWAVYREKVAAGVRASNGKLSWEPPAEHAAMFEDLRTKVGSTEARRLVEDHIRVVARRRASAVRRDLHGADA